MLKEFKAFLMRGNVVDLAVAVVIGAAFTAIVNSLVADIITPAILNPAIEAAGVKNLEELAWGAMKYGKFIAAIINFIIVGFVLFMIIKGVNKIQSIKKKEEAEILILILTTLQKTLLVLIQFIRIIMQLM